MTMNSVEKDPQGFGLSNSCDDVTIGAVNLCVRTLFKPGHLPFDDMFTE